MLLGSSHIVFFLNVSVCVCVSVFPAACDNHFIQEGFFGEHDSFSARTTRACKKQLAILLRLDNASVASLFHQFNNAICSEVFRTASKSY